jgi:hypothetical protein
MYVHGIGFPEEFGVALAEFLGEREVVNGYSNAQAAGQVFNGAEDLAASVVAYFKSMVGTGMVYLYIQLELPALATTTTKFGHTTVPSI